MPSTIVNKIGKARRLNLKSGEYLFKEGEDPSDIYYVQNGKLFISFSATENSGLYKTLKGDNLLGIEEIILNKPYRGSAFAMSDTILLAIKKDKFLETLKSKPGLKLELMQYISKNSNVE